MDNPDRPERAFHLESWRIAPVTMQSLGETVVIDELDRVIVIFHGENHRANANRVLKTLASPEVRKKEAVNYATRDLLRVNRRLKAKLSEKHQEVQTFASFLRRALEAGVKG